MRPAEFVPTPAVPARETFSIGSALSRSFSIWGRNVPFFFGVSFLAYLPMLLFSAGVPTTLTGAALWLLGIGTSSILAFIVQGLLTYSVLEQLRGRVPPPSESLAKGWAKAGPLFVAAVVTGILLIGAAFLLVIPAIILGVRWALLSPVVVAEGSADPRKRSAELTAGHRWAIFGVILLFLIASTALGAIIAVIVGQPTSFVPRLIGQILPSALTLSVSSVLYSVMYYQLRSEKEGVDIEQLTAVFR